MVINGCKSLIIRCHFCTRLKEYSFNLFNMKTGEKIKYRCDCGEENIIISRDNKRLKIYINCFICGSKHYYNLHIHNILLNDNLINCAYGHEVLFLGDKQRANNMLLERSLNVGSSIGENISKECFSNFEILAKVLTIIYDLKRRSKIKCSCGFSQINIELFSDRVELKCLNCHSVKLIFAETEEDLSVLEKKDNILLEEKNISCIDSMKENDNAKNKRRI
ncbi:hypothetical protein [Tepidimicrobium xylanilyticum]|uniref:Uncharacterized protein n=1 Tax=Tepidimicrobium xylanilyticum TaxID=1123352 RepID=A0A1H2R7A2_9FIRM|nr:hypothetical protein [Tepidimicrobium xylanilyticum]GMG95510.1 hypothetical protein EN5CB1_03360 [Tepidimicrobium xylanilyticum]SDW14549.1 hypothetical protein SAMN05660923_00293 [Tepidimicrobium xylanilyticum]